MKWFSDFLFLPVSRGFPSWMWEGLTFLLPSLLFGHVSIDFYFPTGFILRQTTYSNLSWLFCKLETDSILKSEKINVNIN